MSVHSIFPELSAQLLAQHLNLVCFHYTTSAKPCAFSPQLVGSVLGALFCLMQRRGFHPPPRTIFPLELTWVLTQFPPKTLSDESINQGLVCAHMHSIALTQKILTFMSKTGECRQEKHTQHAPSTKTECDYLNGWITKTRPHTQKSVPNW